MNGFSRNAKLFQLSSITRHAFADYIILDPKTTVALLRAKKPKSDSPLRRIIETSKPRAANFFEYFEGDPSFPNQTPVSGIEDNLHLRPEEAPCKALLALP
jgi:hypothetical protein